MLNLYLRYFDLQRTSEIVERLRVSLQDAPIDFENVYLVLGDFTGLVEGSSEIEATRAVTTRRTTTTTNGFVNGDAKLKWSDNGETNGGGGGGEEGAEKRNGVNAEEDSAMTVEDILNDFQYSQLFEANTTSFVDLAHGQEIDDGLNVSHAPPKNIKKSSCNILCRDKLPPVTDPFREAIYRTKSPLDLRKVPSAKERNQRSWMTEKLTGHSSVIREGLCHMAIPRDWTWGGPASDHCPIWIECYKRVEKEAVAAPTLMTGSSGRVAKELFAAGAAVISLSEAMNGVNLITDSPKPVTNGSAGKRLQRLSSTTSNGNGGGGARSLDENSLRPAQ